MRRRRDQSIEIQQMRYFEEQQQKVRKKRFLTITSIFVHVFDVTKLMRNPQGVIFLRIFRELTSE